MRRFFIILTALFGSASVMSAQDLITLKTGNEIKAIVQEIGADVVKYKRYENAQGPSYSILKAEIFMIKYENGTKDVFEQDSNPPAPPAQPPVQPQPQPQADANSGTKTQSVQSTSATQTGGNSNPVPVNTDKKVRFGIQLGGLMSNMNSVDFNPGEWFDGWKVSPKYGFTGGILLEIKLAKVFSLQPGLSFTMKGCMREGYTNLVYVDDDRTAYEDAYVERKLNTSYLELPFHFVFNIPVNKHYFNIGIGPYVAYGIKGKSKNHFTYEGEDIDDTMVDSSLEYDLFSGDQKWYNPLDYGLSGFVGVAFSDRFLIRAGYSHGLANISSDTEYLETDVKNNYFHLSLGLKF
jgi:hypothetical protein